MNFYKFTPSAGRSIPLAAVTTPAASQREDEFSRRIRELETEKRQLENHCANLSAELSAEHAKVESLSAMRARFPALSGAKFINADVMAGFRPGEHTITINRGESDGIRKGQYVFADNSIIGLIDQAWSRTAVVSLISGKDSLIAVEIPDSKAVGIMKGTNKDSACIALNKKRVKEGDIVYTYKNPGLLDAPIIVGKVAECKKNDDHPLLWDILVKPVIKIEGVISVTVVVMNP